MRMNLYMMMMMMMSMSRVTSIVVGGMGWFTAELQNAFGAYHYLAALEKIIWVNSVWMSSTEMSAVGSQRQSHVLQ
jgi:hypothetical protein